MEGSRTEEIEAEEKWWESTGISIEAQKSLSSHEIRKAYHKLALRLHRDKNPDDEEAKEKFQQLQKVMSILGDGEERAVYQTGSIDDVDLCGDALDNLKDFFQAMYKKVAATYENRAHHFVL